jgi:rod shape-determining protein MreB and related proteins
VVNEPSAVALDDRTGEVQAVGKEAKEMLGRTPGNIRVVKPLKNRVIADFRVKVEEILRSEVAGTLSTF